MTPKTAVIHIGTAKTGTTSIQRCLAQAQANGSLDRIRYPLWKNDYNQQRLALIYPPGAIWSSWMRQFLPNGDRRFRRMRDQYRKFLFDELRSCQGAVISAEMLNSFSPQSVMKLRNDLQELGYGEFRIVLYVRDPADLYLSNTAQLLRGPAVPPLIEDPAYFRYEFRRAAETWEGIFPGRLIVRTLPNTARHDVVKDFAGLLQQYLDVTLPDVPARMNTTISAEAMQILDDYRRAFWPNNGGLLTPDTARLVHFLRESHRQIPQTKPTLKPDVAALIRGNHQADAEVLRSRYGVDLGLAGCTPTTQLPNRRTYRTGDILASVDQNAVHQLLLQLARAELGRRPTKRPLPVRVAAKAYRTLPRAVRPTTLDEQLKKRFAR